MFGYVLLLLLFCLFFSVSFYFGFREWRRPWDAAPLPIDVEYVRAENYFGGAFRAKMQEWVAEALPNGTPARGLQARVPLKTSSGEPLLTLAGGRLASQSERDELVYCEGDLTLAGGSAFRREIYCRGRLESEAAVRLQSVAADGDLILGRENDVARWVDAEGKIALRSGTVVRNRVSSLESVELEPGVLAQSLYAPLICTAECHLKPNPDEGKGVPPIAEDAKARSLRDGNPEAKKPMVIPATQGSAAEALPSYLEGLRCSQLAPGTWLVPVDLDLPPGSRVECNLIVRGTLCSGGDCYFTRDVKAARVRLGGHNRVWGNLVSDGSIEVGPANLLARNVAAETDVRLSPGTRVGQPGSPAVVSAGGEVILEQNVAICGKVAAGRWVRTV